MSEPWYTPRLTTPSSSDLNWIMYTYGGYNAYTYPGNPQYAPGSVLSNCTSYSWGRWREILGYWHNLPIANGGNWYGHSGDGYQRSTTTPKLGCVACWGGPGVDGHVAIVEEIIYWSDMSVNYCTVSQSNYNGMTFGTRTIRPSNNWWIYNDVGTFQGFIYLPIDFPLPCPMDPGSRKKVRINIR